MTKLMRFKLPLFMWCLLLLAFIWSAVALSFPLPNHTATQVISHQVINNHINNQNLEQHSHKSHGICAQFHSHAHLIPLLYKLNYFILTQNKTSYPCNELPVLQSKARHTRVFRPPIATLI